jgi:hypothetical protein
MLLGVPWLAVVLATCLVGTVKALFIALERYAPTTTGNTVNLPNTVPFLTVYSCIP